MILIALKTIEYALQEQLEIEKEKLRQTEYGSEEYNKINEMVGHIEFALKEFKLTEWR